MSSDISHEAVRSFSELLSIDETERAEKFHFARDRRRWVVSRGALRVILGPWTGLSPERVGLSYTPTGKPFLSMEMASDAPKFSLSHSSDITIVAVSAHRELGVDVEKLRGVTNLERVALSHFTTRGQEMLRAAPPRQRSAVFLALWTRREAVAKAQGLDLAAALLEAGPPAFPIGRSAVLERGRT